VFSLQGFVRALTRPDTLPCLVTERYFRGEPKDYKEEALTPSIYRDIGLLSNEPNIYREMQRFNDQEFRDDKTTADKLSRMQHYSAPTRLIDMSEDALSALYFAVAEWKSESKPDSQDICPVVYVIDVAPRNLRYYDSDAVSVVANLVKSPLSSSFSDDPQKNKQAIISDALKFREDIDSFNRQKSIEFLLHDVKEEKHYFSSIIDPKHIFSVQCVKPKFTHSRINSQKGAFLLFGLDPNDVRKNIHLIEKCGDDLYLCRNSTNTIQHPVERITKMVIKNPFRMKCELNKLGVRTPFIFPEMDKVAKYLSDLYSSKN
jgi:hypothetical protein